MVETTEIEISMVETFLSLRVVFGPKHGLISPNYLSDPLLFPFDHIQA